jgi:hypothetical protein
MSDPDYESEVFRLAVAAAFYHPAPDERAVLRTLLDHWLGKLGDPLPADGIRQVLASAKGTEIEPFVLTGADLDCAVFLTQAAFSKAGAQTRLRIVSRDTIGDEGGLVLTQNLKSYYVERYAHGRQLPQPKVGWTFIPSMIPASSAKCQQFISATLHSEDQGFRIVVAMPETKSDAAHYARQFQQHGGIEGVSQSLTQLGLRVECRKAQVHILSGSPESMIRIMAHMVSERTLTLKGGPDGGEMPTVLISLRMPEDKPVELPAVLSMSPGYSCWMSVKVPVPVPVTDAHRLAIASWLRPRKEWVNLVFDHRK